MRTIYLNIVFLLFWLWESQRNFYVGAQKVGDLYFYAQDGQEKCFSEEARHDMTLTINYATYEKLEGDCVITIRDSKRRPLTSKDVTNKVPQGRIAYFVKENGEYLICAFCHSSPWFSATSRKWSISVDMGDYSLNTSSISGQEELKDSENFISAIQKKLQDIQQDNKYQHAQEEKYRSIYDQINSHVIKFAILEVVIMACVTVFAVFHLSRYFHSQKLY